MCCVQAEESDKDNEPSSSDDEELHEWDSRCTSCAKAVSRCFPNNGIEDDCQYKRHDGRCFKCRGPAPGEGHFMPALGELQHIVTVAELEPIFVCLPSTTISIIVEFITPQALRPYTLADYKEKDGQDWSGENDIHNAGDFLRLMNIRGVQIYGGGSVQLDLRWFRLCRCPASPCACISESAYAAKLCEFLGVKEELPDIMHNGGYWFDVGL